MGRNKKGSATSQVIFVCLFIVYIALPLFFTLVQKAIVYHQTDKIKRTTEMAVISMISQNDTSLMSQGIVWITKDPSMFVNEIYESLNGLGKGMLTVNKQDIDVRFFDKYEACTCGHVSEHFVICADINATIDILGKIDFSIHKHIEFPVMLAAN